MSDNTNPPTQTWGTNAADFVGNWTDLSSQAQSKPQIVIQNDPLQVSFLNDPNVSSQGNPYSATFTAQCTIEVPVNGATWVISAAGHDPNDPNKKCISASSTVEGVPFTVDPTEGERYTEEDTL